MTVSLRATPNYLTCTRGGATALVAVAVTVITISATAFISDAKWMRGGAEALKAATNAAGIAVTQRLRTQPHAPQSDLETVAYRYIAHNLHANFGSDVEVTVTLDIDRDAGIVNVRSTAEMPGLIWNQEFDTGNMTRASTVGVNATPTWSVLAIDTSRSMHLGLNGAAVWPHDARLALAKEGARAFVNAVRPSRMNGIAVGLVLWSDAVEAEHTPSYDASDAIAAIDAITADGNSTASSRGVRAARMMLAGAPADTRKVIVLLTDGEDNDTLEGDPCRNATECRTFRTTQCQLAREAGIQIFAIGAGRDATAHMLAGLQACSGSAEHTFANVAPNGVGGDRMREIFGAVAAQLNPVRRTM